MKKHKWEQDQISHMKVSSCSLIGSCIHFPYALHTGLLCDMPW